MRLKTSLQLILFIAVLFLTAGCNNKPAAAADATFVRYRITYLQSMAGDIPTRILPKNMDCYYSKDYVVTEIDGFFGQFNLMQVADLRRKEVITLLSVFGNKVAYRSKKGELPASVHPIAGLNYTITKDTVRIAGLLSHKVQVTSDDDKYDIYYTTDIPVKKPNITTPYSQIDFPLTDFKVSLSKLDMRLTVAEHRSEIVPPGFFEIPEEYKKVSRSEMEEYINLLFTKD